MISQEQFEIECVDVCNRYEESHKECPKALFISSSLANKFNLLSVRYLLGIAVVVIPNNKNIIGAFDFVIKS